MTSSLERCRFFRNKSFFIHFSPKNLDVSSHKLSIAPEAPESQNVPICTSIFTAAGKMVPSENENHLFFTSDLHLFTLSLNYDKHLLTIEGKISKQSWISNSKSWVDIVKLRKSIVLVTSLVLQKSTKKKTHCNNKSTYCFLIIFRKHMCSCVVFLCRPS